MSDQDQGEANSGSAPSSNPIEERIKNQNAEFDRKLGNVIKVIEEQNKNFTALINTVVTAQPKQTTKSDPKLKDLMYDDPDLYVQTVADRATEAASREVKSILTVAQQRQNSLNQLVSDYPELTDPNTDLYKKAIGIYNTLSDSEKDAPNAYRIAVREAAAEVGVLPTSKRARPNSNEDDFTFGNSSGGGSNARPRQEKVSDKTMAFANAIGRNIDDPKLVERLKKAAQRKDWTRYR